MNFFLYQDVIRSGTKGTLRSLWMVCFETSNGALVILRGVLSFEGLGGLGLEAPAFYPVNP